MQINSSHTVPSNHDPVLGDGPIIFWDTVAPDGDAEPWFNAPVGSVYIRSGTTPVIYRKVANEGADTDWGSLGLNVISETVTRADFTDGGSTVGTYTMTQSIPVGAWVLRAKLRAVTGFTGDTSAVLTIGDGTDVDRYNAATPSIFTTANAIDMGAPSGTQIHTAAATPVLTVTSGTDFTAVSAGAMTVEIMYWL